MAKRMKKVFSSHSQLCHVWAQQTQSEGRASRMFFTNTTDIYSYGYHYLAAKVHTVKGKKFALVRSDAYSNSTAKHLNEIRHSLHGLMPQFNVSGSNAINDPKLAVKDLDSNAQTSVARALKRVKVESEESIAYEFERIREKFTLANKLRKILGLAEKFPKKSQLDAVEKHLKFRLKRYHELNTPEMIQKRELEREKRKAKAEEKLKEKLAHDIAGWRDFTFNSMYSLYSLPNVLLRVRGETVETSRGASVPLKEARTLLRAIVAGKNVKGLTVGHFTLISVTDIGNDKLIKIGCHNILLSEAQQVLEPKLSLVSA